MKRTILQFGAALASGIVFGFGLSLSGMLNRLFAAFVFVVAFYILYRSRGSLLTG